MKLIAALVSLLICHLSWHDEATSKELDLDERLLLSPFIKNGSLDLARQLSRVNLTGFADNVTSHSGYLSVNETHNTNLFFWFFRAAKAKSAKAPLLVWLQGGPGQTSLYGLFNEMGPFSVDDKGEKLIVNPHSWHYDHNLMFVDNPVGAGFSFTDSENGYAMDQNTIAEHLYSFLTQFFKIYPDMGEVPLYICGESYGGKHVLSLANHIIINNSTAGSKINLKGIAIGNGYIDPVNQLPHAELLYYMGLMDENERRNLKSLEDECIANSTGGDLKMMRKCDIEIVTLTLYTGVPEFNNLAADAEYDIREPFSTFVLRPEVRRRLHAGAVATFEPYFTRVEPDDYMASARPWLERTLDAGVKTMLYSGQYDLNLPYSAAAAMYRRLEWSGGEEYLAAKRRHWKHGGVLAGYTKRARNFVEVMVRSAGHMVPADQPERALSLIKSFVGDYDNSF